MPAYSPVTLGTFRIVAVPLVKSPVEHERAKSTGSTQLHAANVALIVAVVMSVLPR